MLWQRLQGKVVTASMCGWPKALIRGVAPKRYSSPNSGRPGRKMSRSATVPVVRPSVPSRSSPVQAAEAVAVAITLAIQGVVGEEVLQHQLASRPSNSRLRAVVDQGVGPCLPALAAK